MANPTSNFNWQMPTSTDLVTDLPADFEVFGQAVDSSMADLLGGTTGQVLSKTSGTDMDFTWVDTDDTNAIQNAIVDAKGDLIAASAADTPARLAVGADGETLVADSAATTGLRYSPAPAIGNPILNSAYQVWQRNTSATYTGATNQYTGADRWSYLGSAGSSATISRQATGDTTNLPNIQYCTRYLRTAANTDTNTLYFAQTFETINTYQFVGKTITLSFYARKGANYSAASSYLAANLAYGTGTDQALNGGAAANNIVTQQNVLTSTWTRFSVTAAVPTAATQLVSMFTFVPVGTAGAADYYEITGVQIDQGSVALPFRTYAATIQGELAACQRYFQVITAGPTTGINSTTQVAFNPAFAPMRSSSITFALTGALAITDVYTADFSQSSSNITTNINNGVSGAVLSFGNFTGLTAYRNYSLKSNNQITASAEL